MTGIITMNDEFWSWYNQLPEPKRFYVFLGIVVPAWCIPPIFLGHPTAGFTSLLILCVIISCKISAQSPGRIKDDTH